MFAAMHTYAYTLMALGVLVGAVLLVIKNVKKDIRDGEYQLRLPKTGLNFLFLVMILFLFFQIIPLPYFLIKLLSPSAWVVAEKSLAASSSVGQGSDVNAWFSLSPYVYPVRMSIVRFVVYGLFFLGLIQVLNSERRIVLTITLILVVGCFEALYGLIQAYSGSPHVLWFKSITDRKAATGTYINRNHFAGFMEMGLVLAASFSAALSGRRGKNPAVKKDKGSFRFRLSRFLSGEQRFSRRILVLFAGVVMGIGLVFSASRGGIIAAAGALLCLSLFFVFRRDHRRKGIIFLVLFVVTFLYALDIGVDYVVSRFATLDAGYEGRARYAKKTIEMFEDYKLTGIGVGNFKYAYPRYQAREDKKVFVRFAHNDWAQFLAEAGIAGVVLLLAGISVYLYLVLRLLRKRKDPFAVCLGIAPVAALVAIGIHSFVDFNLHIPANFLILVAIMAIGYAALHLERHHRRDRMSYQYYTIALKYRGAVVLALILGLIVWTGFVTIRHFMAEAYCNTVPNSTLNRDQDPVVEEIVKAIEWDGGNAEYWYKLAERLGGQEEVNGYLLLVNRVLAPVESARPIRLSESDGGQASLSEGIQLSKDGGTKGDVGLRTSDFRRLALQRAVELNPFEAQYHLRLGWAYAHQWKEKDYHTKWLPAADISMDRAAYFAGVANPRLHVELGNYWVMRSKTILPNNPGHHSAWDKACWHYQKAQSLEQGGTLKAMKKEIRDYVWNFYPDEEMVGQIVQ